MAGYKGGGYKRKGVVYQGPTKPRGRPAKAASVAMVQAVAKKVVDKNKIYKIVTNDTVFDKVNIPGAGLNLGTGMGQVAGIAPLITQGSGESNREGNIVSVKSFKLRYCVKALPTTIAGGSNAHNGVPFLVRVVVFRHKFNIGDNTPSQIIDLNNSSGALTSNLDTYFRNYNKDEYYIAYSKTHRMSAPSHFDGTNITPSNQDPKTSAFIYKTCKIKMPSKLYFNDSASTPTNAGWWVGVAVCNTDDAVLANTTIRATINAESILEFCDE